MVCAADAVDAWIVICDIQHGLWRLAHLGHKQHLSATCSNIFDHLTNVWVRINGAVLKSA